LKIFNFIFNKNKTITTTIIIKSTVIINNNNRDNDEPVSFFLGGNNGVIYYINEKFQCIESTNVYKPILSLNIFEKQGIFLAITEDMSLHEFEFRKDGKLFQIVNVCFKKYIYIYIIYKRKKIYLIIIKNKKY